LHWLFQDIEHVWDESQGLLTLMTEAGPYYCRLNHLDGGGTFSLVRGDEESPRGWRAPYYSYREKALSLDLKIDSEKSFFWTLFSPDSCSVTLADEYMNLNAPAWKADLAFNFGEKGCLVKSISLQGTQEDSLVLN
jgi:hypothetical protein